MRRDAHVTEGERGRFDEREVAALSAERQCDVREHLVEHAVGEQRPPLAAAKAVSRRLKEADDAVLAASESVHSSKIHARS